MRKFLARVRKAVVAGVGGGAVIATAALQAGNVIPDKYVGYVQSAVAIVTLLGVYRVPNAPADQADHREVDYRGDIA